MPKNAADGGAQVLLAAGLDGFRQPGLPLLLGSLQPLLRFFLAVSLLLTAAVLAAALLQGACLAGLVLVVQLQHAGLASTFVTLAVDVLSVMSLT